MLYSRKFFIFLLFYTCFLSSCSSQDDMIKPVTAEEFYNRGLESRLAEDYEKALKDFSTCSTTGDAVREEYYVSMCIYEKAFTYYIMGDDKRALNQIDILLSQVISSREPRVLASNLENKILSGNGYKNATY